MTVSVLEHSHLVLVFMCMDDEISIWENEYWYLIIIVINAIFEKLMNKVVNVNECVLQACRNPCRFTRN